MKNTEKSMEKLVALCKGRGFVYAGSEIYGGLANTWDYGPLGVELKTNIKNAWRKKFIQENPYNVGLDSAILMNPQTWVASGHLGGFSDPLMDCRECKTRHRADNLIEDFDGTNVAGWSNEEMTAYNEDGKIDLGKMIEKQDGFTVVAACGDFAGGITAFMKYRPEVVFMDIDLAGESGLDCAKTITELEPKTKIIFATAHSEYMANAFEIYAFDYLVKPFNLERGTKTLTRIKAMQGNNKEIESLAATEEVAQDKVVNVAEQHKDKLMIKGKEQMTFIDKKDIIYIICISIKCSTLIPYNSIKRNYIYNS